MISNIIRIATDIGTGVLATEIIKKLAPTGSMSPIKKIFCGIGAFGLTEHLRQSSVKAVDKDISDVRSTLKVVEKLLSKDEEKDESTQEEVDHFFDNMSDEDFCKMFEPMIDSIPASLLRAGLMKETSNDPEVLDELESMSDEEVIDLMKEALAPNGKLNPNIKAGTLNGIKQKFEVIK